MQLEHLIPHLDAEIDRLQKARDLLALFLLFQQSGTTSDADRSMEEHSSEAPIFDKQFDKQIEPAIAAPASEPAPSQPEVIRLKMRRSRIAREQPRSRRIREAGAVDTALRGLVPAGPIVVSAAEVLKSQAAKTAQATRAAEVKRAGNEPGSSAAWRDRSSDMRHVDAMLQRLINIGEDDAEQVAASRLP